MANGQYIALSAAVAHGTQLEIIANNLANINTTGYKQLRTSFDQHLVDAKGESTKGFTAIATMKTDLGAGSLIETGNPLDVALHADGFFLVRTPSGDNLTRAGSFRVTKDGTLVDTKGHPVLQGSVNGTFEPINLDPLSATTVSPLGGIEQDGTIVAKLSVVTTAAENLTPMGDATYRAKPDTYTDVENPEVAVGYLESSNVNAIRGMVDLIETTRAYEQSQRIMKQYQRLDKRTLDVV